MVPQITGYEIVTEIGRGGMATVYKALQPSLKRYVALKVLPPYFTHDEEFVARFKHEALAVAKLRHPNIVQVYDFHEEGKWLYLAMEYVPGGSLKDQLSKEKRLPWKRAVKLATDIAQALHHAHEKGFIHRDIKPSNILLGEEEQAIVSDFGIVKALEGTSLTRNASVNIIGTSEYMSPEQASGEAVDRRSDIYSLGVMFYEMLTGMPPFVSSSPVSILHQHIYEPPRPIREINPLVPEELELIILKLLNKNPEFRFPDCLSLVKALAPLKLIPLGEDGEKKENPAIFNLPKLTILKAERLVAQKQNKIDEQTKVKIKKAISKKEAADLPPAMRFAKSTSLFVNSFFALSLIFAILLFYKSNSLPTFTYKFKPSLHRSVSMQRELQWFKNQKLLKVELRVVNKGRKSTRFQVREVLAPTFNLKQTYFKPQAKLKSGVASWIVLLKPSKPQIINYQVRQQTLTKKQFITLVNKFPAMQPVALIVRPDQLLLKEGQQKSLSVKLRMNDLSLKEVKQVKISITPEDLIKVNRLTVKALKAGQGNLTVQAGHFKTLVKLLIKPVPSSLVIKPTELTAQAVGQPVKLQAELVFSDGSYRLVPPKWMLIHDGSNVPAELNNEGLLTGLAAGTVEIKAVYGKFAAFKTVTFVNQSEPLSQIKPVTVSKRMQVPTKPRSGEVVPLPPLVP